MARARDTLQKTQARFNSDFDKRVRLSSTSPRCGKWLFLDPEDGTNKRQKLQHTVTGPYRDLEIVTITVVIQRGEFVDGVGADRVTPDPAPVSETPLRHVGRRRQKIWR